MRSLILCEGFDDAYILGYFLHKTLGFRPSNSYNFAKNTPYCKKIVKIKELATIKKATTTPLLPFGLLVVKIPL